MQVQNITIYDKLKFQNDIITRLKMLVTKLHLSERFLNNL